MHRLILFLVFLGAVMSVPYFYQIFSSKEGKKEIEKVDQEKNTQINMTENNEMIKKENKKSATQTPIARYHDFIFNNPDLPILGNPKGKMVIVYINDYLCPYCNRGAEALQRLIKKNSDVRVIIFNAPKLAEKSRELARISLNFYASFPEYFEQMSQKLNLFRRSGFDLQKEMAAMGLDYEQYQQNFDLEKLNKIVDKSIVIAREIGVKTVPAYIIKDHFYNNSMSLIDLEMALQKQYDEN